MALVDWWAAARARARQHGPVAVAVAAGGVIGSEARYLVGQLPSGPGPWPWATLLENVSGCLLLGVLMTVILQRTVPHRLVRPFLGVGVLGGYTTFSTYAVDVQLMLVDGRPAAALGYLLVTPVAALSAVATGAVVARAVLRRVDRAVVR